MNHSTLFRSLSLGLATLALVSTSFAGASEQDQQLNMARNMAQTDAQVALDLQNWLTTHDVELLAQADGLITNDLRARAEHDTVAQIAEADGLLVASYDIADSQPESSPATRNPGAVLVATKTR